MSGRRCKSRHRKCWVLSGMWLWCYECGALRAYGSPPAKWTYPVGPDGANPAPTATPPQQEEG